jgi:hypothetical protein
MTQTNARGPAWGKGLVLGFLLAALLAVSLTLAASKPAPAATIFTVNLQGDQPDFSGPDGRCDLDASAANGLQCTLRAAIQQANATSGADTINFAIPSLGVKTIRPNSALPVIIEQVTIDGYSQRPCSTNPAPCSSPNTLAQGTNANLLIELDLANAGALEIEANNTVVRGLVGNRISANSIFSNGRLGIDLRGGTENAAGATANDPKDPDQGANDLQNKPVITSAKTVSGTTTIQAKLNSTPTEPFVVEFFSNPSGNEGQKFIGNKAVSTNSNGNITFSFVPSQPVPVGQSITATATNVVEANTSEFSAPRTVVAG